MKITLLVLVGSLGLNALLLAGFARRGGREVSLASRSPAGAPAADKTSAQNAALKADGLMALEPAALRAELQRRGFGPEATDALVRARIYARHDARRKELIAEAMKRPWWESVSVSVLNSLPNPLTAAQRKELRDLEAVARNETLALLGPEAFDSDGAIAARYNFTTPERAVKLDGLLRDYADLGAALREEMHGLRTAADREREALLETERQRDLTALLTSTEREIFALRTGPGADIVRYRLGGFEPTEQEYRAIIAVHQEFAASHPGSIDPSGRERPANIRDHPEYEDKIRAALGEARHADWSLTEQDYMQAIVRYAPELGVTPATMRESALVLRDAAARSWALVEETGKTGPEKKAELATLVEATRRTLAARLGEAGSKAVLNDLRWFETMSNGYAVQVNRGAMTYRPVDGSRPPPVLPGKK